MSRKKHEAHHGGAWKVAYADFVTAMMALFLVLWIASQDTKIKKAVERSFRNPFATLPKGATGLQPEANSTAVKDSKGDYSDAAAVELQFLRQISQDIIKYLEPNPEVDDKTTQIDVSSEGLRINVFDRARRPVFEKDSAAFTDYGKFLFSTLAWQVASYTNLFKVELEGHTEAGHKDRSPEYGEWELSTDRANAARRMFMDYDVKPAQVQKVAGFGSTVPMDGSQPADECNRRVTVMLRISSGNR